MSNVQERTMIIVPTYNEIENLQAISDAILGITPQEVNLLIVDDGSPDGTGKLADEIAAKNPRFHVLHRSKKQGLGPAYVAGFRYSFEKGFNRVIQMDADFSHHPRYLPQMLKLLNETDYVIGSRYVEGGGTVNWGIMRKIISRGGSLYARTILGAPIRDYTGGFVGWNRRVLEAIQLDTMEAGGYSFQIELKYRAYTLGFKFKEMAIIFEDRRVGKSKMSSKIFIEALGLVPRLRFKHKCPPRIQADSRS